jgi:starch phosphorylase
MTELTTTASVAYFSMEIGLSNDIPSFSGGLGVLAGDTLKAAADCSFPVVGLTLLYSKGYFEQSIDSTGGQLETPTRWDPCQKLTPLETRAEVFIEGRSVKIQPWLYLIPGITGHKLPVLFLDTNLPENSPQDRDITGQLYGGDNTTRIIQEVVLGIGGVKILTALGFNHISTYHMNEGHAAFLTLELLARLNWNNDEVRKHCVFTTHTPVPAGHDEFPYELAYKIMERYLPWHIKDIAGKEKLNMTILALNLSRFANGVAQKHGEVSRNMFPDFDIDAITNGVHSVTWTAESFQKLYDRYIPEWRKTPEHLSKALMIPDKDIVAAHETEKKRLFDYIKQTTGITLDQNILTIGFARRAAPYKRGDLIFTDIARLVGMCQGKVQFVFAGKAHPRDAQGKEIIKHINDVINQLRFEGKITAVFLPNYNMNLGALITAGVDVWLNTPIRPREASGTSGMKAVHNGVPNFSVLDGWWIEGWDENITGWAIGPEATETNLVENNNAEDVEDLYDKLENIIIPMYYTNRPQWISIMKNAIAKNANFFNTSRMVKEYATKAYKLTPITVNH